MATNMKKKNLGYTLIEIILVVGLIGLASIGIYTVYNIKYNAFLANKQASYIEQINKSIGDYLITVSNTNTVTATTDITANLTATNLINARIIPNEMVRNPTSIRNLFDGNITFAPLNLDITPGDAIANPVTTYEMTLTNVPNNACALLSGNSRLATIQQLVVNGTTVKTPGTPLPDIPTMANVCIAGNNTIRMAFMPFKFGINPLGTTNAVGSLRTKEAAFNIAPLAQNAPYAGPACSGGAAWNATTGVCQCGAGTNWNGSSCVAFGTPGQCPLGQGWNLNTNSCQALGTGTGPAVSGVLSAGRYIPSNIAIAAQQTTVGNACAATALPTGATAATNGVGNFDTRICNKCINGTWNGSRCVTP